MKHIRTILLLAAALLLLGSAAACGGGDSSSSSKSYDYYDNKGNGYNDEDVNWDGGGKGNKSKGWDDAVNDWNRANGY